MSVLAVPPLDRPTLRLLPAPDADPPDDDVAGPRGGSEPVPGGQATLALHFVLPSGVSAGPEPVATPDAGTTGTDAVDHVFDRRRTATGELPDPGAWSRRLAQATVEVLCGARPVAQLRRWTSDEVYEQLRRTMRRRTPRVAEPRGGPARPPRVVVRAVRVCEVAEGTVEGCAVVDDGRRARALVLRLEGADGRWRCTQLAQV